MTIGVLQEGRGEQPTHDPSITRVQRQHLTTIDALRGFAAMSVVLFHLGGASLPKLNSALTLRLTSWGWTGVEMFFVISGFVIPFVLMKGSYHLSDCGNFLGRRFIRIWPPAAVLIAFTVAQYAVVTWIQGAQSDEWASLSMGMVLANLFYVAPLTGHPWLNGILWTLAVEFQYYVFLALAFPFLRSSRGCLIAAGFASLVTAQLPGAEIIQFLSFAIFFAMGGLVLLYRERQVGTMTFLAILAVMASVALAQLGLLATSFATATALIIAFVTINNRVLMFFGTISYSLYLVHILVASTAEFVLVKTLGPSTPLARFATQMACLVIAVVGAWVFYLLVERHFVTLSQRFDRRSGKHVALPPTHTISDEGI